MTSTTNEFELPSPPSDGISSLQICDNRYLLVSSWDTKLRFYDLASRELKRTFSHKAAILDCCFASKDIAASGGLDKNFILTDLNSGSETILGTHSKAIKSIKYSKDYGLFVTGSWDSSIKAWDPRSQTPCIATSSAPERVYTMSNTGEKLVVGTAGRQIWIYDIRSLDKPLQKRESSLKFQTRTIACFPDGNGYAVGSIEGKVAIEYFDESQEVQLKKYAFKCHRVTTNGVEAVYPVNVIAFHPVYGTFATGGCDCVVNVWDGQNRKRLAQLKRYPSSIASMSFSEDGNTLAIASSYTYEEGEKDHPADQIFIRSVTDLEVKPKHLLTQK